MSWTPRGTPFAATDTISTLALSLSSARAPTAGDLMLVCVGIRNSDTATITSVADDQGGTWTRLIRHATAGQFVEQWSGVAAASANTVITITFSTAVQSNGVAQAIGSSVGSWFKQDEATGATAAGTTHTPGTVDAISGDLLSTMTTVATAYTLGALATDYDQIGTMSRAICQRRIAAGTISPDGAWTTTAAEDTVSTHVVLREGSAGLSTTSTAATASWVTPAATAETPGASTSTAASATWTAPASAAAPGAVTRASTAASALWIALEGTSAPGAVTTPSTAASAAWTVPASAAAPGAVTASSTVATASWSAPSATAAPGAITTASVVAVASWVTPASTATLAGVIASTPAVASWVTPAATATPGAIGASSTPATASWSAPAATAAPGGVTSASAAPSASWTAPAATATNGSATAASTPAASVWMTAPATASGAAVATSSVPAFAAWVVPAASASPEGLIVPDVIVMGAISTSTLATVGPITVSEAIVLGTITQVGEP